MAKRRTKRAIARAKKLANKEAGMKKPGGESEYARKRRYCHKNAVWGFDVPEPKPWKKK